MTEGSSRIVCHCQKVRHSALDCYNRMNYSFQGRHPATQLAALVANQNYTYCASYCSILFRIIREIKGKMH